MAEGLAAAARVTAAARAMAAAARVTAAARAMAVAVRATNRRSPPRWSAGMLRDTPCARARGVDVQVEPQRWLGECHPVP